MTPSFSDAATADALQIMPIQFFCADSVPMLHVTRLLTLINASSGRIIQSETGRTSTCKGSFSIDADPTSFTDSRVEVAFIDVRARFPVYFCVADGAFTFHGVAHLAWTTPSQSDGATTLGFEGQSG